MTPTRATPPPGEPVPWGPGTRVHADSSVRRDADDHARFDDAAEHDPPPRPSVEDVATAVIEAADVVHRALGPGLLEHVYEVVLGHELIRRGLPVERQRVFPVRYGRIVIKKGFRADLVVDARVLVEVKVASRLVAVHRQQVLSYCRMGPFPLGLLINFGGDAIDGHVQRIEPDRSDGRGRPRT